MKLLHIASSREIGKVCYQWACNNLPEGWQHTDDPNESDVYISVMYDSLLDERFINGVGASGVPRRCYNFHPGILPQYRGSGAFSWSIINGEKECGITLHELDVDIDHGPIISCWKWPIRVTDTAETLFNTGMVKIEQLFKEFLPLLLANTASSEPQDESKAKVYYRKDLQKAMDLSRIIRAFTFEGKPSAHYVNRHGTKVEVTW